MNDEIKNLARKIERTVCKDCLHGRYDRTCLTCPVEELIALCRNDGYVKRTLISRQMFEYLCDLGVVVYDGVRSFHPVVHPDGMDYCSLLDGNMREDLLKDTPRSISFNTETHESHDTKIPWVIPEWLFMENQMRVLKAYFRRKDKWQLQES